MANKFFTIMIVPEKSNQVRRLVIPSYLYKGGILSLAFLAVLAMIMVLDYANVMNQINENKQLKVENRQLRQSVQVFKTKMVTMENTLDRVKTFVTKLRIITNIEEPAATAPGTLSLPPASTPASAPANLPVSTPQNSSPAIPMSPPNPQNPKTSMADPATAAPPPPTNADLKMLEGQEQAAPVAAVDPYEVTRSKRLNLLAALMVDTGQGFTSLSDADNSAFVQGEFEKLDDAYEDVNKFALATEQETQDLLERLGEKRELLAHRPTILPTRGGYVSSPWGMRSSPFDGRTKMHEGVDIANRYGADIVAPADGTVSFAGYKEGYGKVVILDHGTGVETLFGHSSKVMVKTGEKVHRGQRIAAVGSTGHSTGPHVHYEVRLLGTPDDPCYYILDTSCTRLTRARAAVVRRSRPLDPDLVDQE